MDTEYPHDHVRFQKIIYSEITQGLFLLKEWHKFHLIAVSLKFKFELATASYHMSGEVMKRLTRLNFIDSAFERFADRCSTEHIYLPVIKITCCSLCMQKSQVREW